MEVRFNDCPVQCVKSVGKIRENVKSIHLSLLIPTATIVLLTRIIQIFLQLNHNSHQIRASVNYFVNFCLQ